MSAPGPEEAIVAGRVLMVISAGAGALEHAARSAAAVARESGGVVRIAWMQPVPPPRVDRHDRVVADTDREMARLAERAHERMSALAWELGEGLTPTPRLSRYSTSRPPKNGQWGFMIADPKPPPIIGPEPAKLTNLFFTSYTAPPTMNSGAVYKDESPNK